MFTAQLFRDSFYKRVVVPIAIHLSGGASCDNVTALLVHQKESLFTAYLLRGLVGKDKHGLSLVVRVQ